MLLKVSLLVGHSEQQSERSWKLFIPDLPSQFECQDDRPGKFEMRPDWGANSFLPNFFSPIGLQDAAFGASVRTSLFAHSWPHPSGACHSPFRDRCPGLRAEPWRCGLVCYVGAAHRIGELTRHSIELIGPPPQEVRNRSYNRDVEQPWIRRRLAPNVSITIRDAGSSYGIVGTWKRRAKLLSRYRPICWTRPSARAARESRRRCGPDCIWWRHRTRTPSFAR